MQRTVKGFHQIIPPKNLTKKPHHPIRGERYRSGIETLPDQMAGNLNIQADVPLAQISKSIPDRCDNFDQEEQSMQTRTYREGEVVFREGDPGELMYRIVKGKVSIHITSLDGEDVRLTELGEGAIFGEMAVLEAWPRSAAAVVREENTLLQEISGEELSTFFHEDPAQLKEVMTSLSHRLRELTEDYIQVSAAVQEIRDRREKGTEGFFKKLAKHIGIYKKTGTYLSALTEGSAPDLTGGAFDDQGKEAVNADAAVSGGLNKGDILFREGDQADCMYFVEKGSVGIFSGYGTEREKRLTVVPRNGFFGEMGMIEKQPRTATAVIRDNHTVLRAIREEELDQMFEQAPVLALRSMQHLSTRLRSMTREYLLACETLANMKEAE